jgi:hypothetical protein
MAAMAWFTSKKGITDINGLLFEYDGLVKSPKAPIFVIPAKAGIQSFQLVKILLDPGFHRGDDFLRVHQVLVKRFLEKSSIGKLYHKINKFHKIRIPFRVKSLPQSKKTSQVFSDSFDPFSLTRENRTWIIGSLIGS